MNCSAVTERLTAYLDGELDPSTASALRGHLRTCAACRTAAEEEARLRDALRALPPLEPPPAMWAGVMAQLGQAEVADGQRSALGRWWARWSTGWMPRLVPAVGLVAALGLAIGAKRWIDARRDQVALAAVVAIRTPVAPVTPVAPEPPVAPVLAVAVDVADDLAGDDARAERAYAAAADDLLALAEDARATWSATQTRDFGARIAVLRAAVATAPAGIDRARAWQALIDYAQRAVVGVRVAEAR